MASLLFTPNRERCEDCVMFWKLDSRIFGEGFQLLSSLLSGFLFLSEDLSASFFASKTQKSPLLFLSGVLPLVAPIFQPQTPACLTSVSCYSVN